MADSPLTSGTGAVHGTRQEKSNSTPTNRTQPGLLSRLERDHPDLVLQVRADFYLDTFWTVFAVLSLSLIHI